MFRLRQQIVSQTPIGQRQMTFRSIVRQLPLLRDVRLSQRTADQRHIARRNFQPTLRADDNVMIAFLRHMSA